MRRKGNLLFKQCFSASGAAAVEKSSEQKPAHQFGEGAICFWFSVCKLFGSGSV